MVQHRSPSREVDCHDPRGDAEVRQHQAAGYPSAPSPDLAPHGQVAPQQVARRSRSRLMRLRKDRGRPRGDPAEVAGPGGHIATRARAGEFQTPPGQVHHGRLEPAVAQRRPASDVPRISRPRLGNVVGCPSRTSTGSTRGTLTLGLRPTRHTMCRGSGLRLRICASQVRLRGLVSAVVKIGSLHRHTPSGLREKHRTVSSMDPASHATAAEYPVRSQNGVCMIHSLPRLSFDRQARRPRGPSPKGHTANDCPGRARPCPSALAYASFNVQIE